MSLDLIVRALNQTKFANDMSASAWKTDYELRAQKVRLFRDYFDGKHRAKLTDEMAKALRISLTNTLEHFNINHIGVIIQTMVDRLSVDRVDADNEAGKQWSAEVLRRNRFDAMQSDVHEAALRDMDAFVLVDWDKEASAVRLTPQPAYDGVDGVLALYTEPGKIGAAIKIWTTTTTHVGDTIRINVYYPDKIEKFVSVGAGGALERYVVEGETWPAPWLMKDNQPIGVAIQHLPNRGAIFSNYGYSEIENAIPPQDVLNRTVYSMVMTAENTAFPIRTAIGDKPPEGLTPGMWIKVYAKDKDGLVTAPSEQQINWFNAIRYDSMKQGDIAPFIEQAKFIKTEMYDITNTPLPGGGSDEASGESQKQRGIRLLGKTKRFQVRAGNFWEDVLALGQRVQMAYGEAPPAFSSLNTVWKSAELRDDAALVRNAKEVRDDIGKSEFLRLLMPVFGWTAAQVEQIIADTGMERQQRAQDAAALLPNFNAFRIPDLAVQ